MQTTPSRPQVQLRTAAFGRRIEAAALYGALTLIGAVVLGTLSVHPF